MKIAIIGGGWAGLSAAVTLSLAKQEVVLLEAAPYWGGRARSINCQGENLDNGQHIIVRAYHKLCQLLATMQIDLQQVFNSQPLTLSMLGLQHDELQLKFSDYPSPLSALLAIATAKGLSAGDKVSLLRCMHKINNQRCCITQDCTVSAFLQTQQQSSRLLACFWEPLCLATLSTPASQASMQVFSQVMREVFTTEGRYGQLLLPKGSLTEIFPQHAIALLAQHGADYVTNARVTKIVREQRCFQVITSTKGAFTADHVIIATTPKSCLRLLAEINNDPQLSKQLAAIKATAITTVYLTFSNPVAIDWPLIGLLTGPGQWVIDRSHCRQANIIATVITGGGPHETMPPAKLAAAVETQLRQHFEKLPSCLSYKVIREKSGAFLATAGSEQLRPANKTSLANLWLAGDYTNTGLPASLESAVRSGTSCAQQLLAI